MSEMKLKINECPVSDSKLNSARESINLKDKFSVFMHRIDSKNSRELLDFKDIIKKRSSELSNNSSESFINNTKSLLKNSKRLSTTHRDCNRSSLKGKPRFSLFEESLKTNRLFYGNRSRNSQNLNSKFNDLTSDEYSRSFSRNFSFLFSKQKKYESITPIKRNLSEIHKRSKFFCSELLLRINEVNENSNKLKKLEFQQSELLNEIKKIRDSRNSLIADKLNYDKQLDNLKVFTNKLEFI